MAEYKTVVGVFKSEGQAEKAVSQLRRHDVDQREISIVAKDRRGQGGGGDREGRQGGMTSLAGEDIGEGVTAGGTIGGLAGLLVGAGALAIPGLGPIIAAGPIAGALSGAVTGGIAGGLVDFGIPEERGREYEEEVRRGNILAVAKVSRDKADRAAQILRENGAESVEVHEPKSH